MPSTFLNLGQPVNSAHPLNRGLVSRYQALPQRFGGSRFIDLQGSRHLSLNGGVTWQGTRRRVGGYGSLSFDGVDDVATFASYPAADAVTACCWVIDLGPNEVGSDYRSIASHHTTDGAASDWYLYFAPGDNKLHIDIPWVLGNAAVSTTTIANFSDTWHHVAFTRSGSSGSWTYTLYIDGQAAGSNTTASNHNTSAHSLNIAGLSSTSVRTRSQVDDLRVWNRCLSDSEVAGVYQFSRLLTDSTLNWIDNRQQIFAQAVVGGGGGFQAAWARGSNIVLGGGLAA